MNNFEAMLRKAKKKPKTHCLANLLGLPGESLGVGDVVVGDGREELLLVLAVERRLTHEHFVEQHAECPPVNRLVVRLVMNDLESTIPICEPNEVWVGFVC